MVNQFLLGAHRNFVYLVSFDGQSIVIDPQRDLGPWEARIHELGSKLVGVMLTHTHWDHVEGVPTIIEKYSTEKLPVYVHEHDAERLKDMPQAVRARLVFIQEGANIPLGRESFEVMHTPGHSAGASSFLLRTKPAQLFTGDTIFVGDVGRTDLETGSTAELFESIQKIKKLPLDTIIYPGHHYGSTPMTTIGRECEQSPAFRCRTSKELDAVP